MWSLGHLPIGFSSKKVFKVTSKGVTGPPCLEYQVGESCAYENASRTPRDTRNSMQVHLVRGAKRQENCARRTWNLRFLLMECRLGSALMRQGKA